MNDSDGKAYDKKIEASDEEARTLYNESSKSGSLVLDACAVVADMCLAITKETSL